MKKNYGTFTSFFDSDAGTPPIPQWVLGTSWMMTSTACAGIPKSTKTCVIPLMIFFAAVGDTPDHILT